MTYNNLRFNILGPAFWGQVASPSQGNTKTHRTINNAHAHSHLNRNLERPIKLTVMFLDPGRMPEYLERTHACTGRTCKLHAERPPAGIQAQDLVAARQQCYQLRHPAALNEKPCNANMIR
ncbi:hypothetical protein GOODEAATRI_016618 [Goodea atripinnis]|uniref:Uncharacterized protein n=1 Tax=Goodea atripinnis TaxID=208336 RepID=A0ABV0NV41_9TELE